jgi:hypothetical protein
MITVVIVHNVDDTTAVVPLQLRLYLNINVHMIGLIIREERREQGKYHLQNILICIVQSELVKQHLH